MSYPEYLVLVIIPIYNRAYLLPRALETVYSQDYHSIEVIIVVDAS